MSAIYRDRLRAARVCSVLAADMKARTGIGRSKEASNARWRSAWPNASGIARLSVGHLWMSTLAAVHDDSPARSTWPAIVRRAQPRSSSMAWRWRPRRELGRDRDVELLKKRLERSAPGTKRGWPGFGRWNVVKTTNCEMRTP